MGRPVTPVIPEDAKRIMTELVADSRVRLIDGDVRVTLPDGSNVTFMHRRPNTMPDKDYYGPTVFVLRGVMGVDPSSKPKVRAYRKTVILAMVRIAFNVVRLAPERIAKNNRVASYVTNLTYTRNAGIVSNYNPAFRGNGAIKVNDRTVDVFIEMKS